MSNQFIAKPGDASDNQPGKYPKVGQRFMAGEPMWMPKIGREADGSLTFRDGRHRYLWMRENGALAMPVAVEKSEAEIVRALCGTRRRTAWFIPHPARVPNAVVYGMIGLAAAAMGILVAARS